jgi:hypothetical protein
VDGPDVWLLRPPVAVRRWNATPLPEVTTIMACREPAVSVSRIMTPAFAHAFVFCRVATRAMISPSPVRGW